MYARSNAVNRSRSSPLKYTLREQTHAPQQNSITFGKEYTSQQPCTGAQDGEHLHSHHVLPMCTQNRRNTVGKQNTEGSLPQHAGELLRVTNEYEGAEEAEHERNQEEVTEITVVGFHDGSVSVPDEDTEHRSSEKHQEGR
ncbi:hypothetical protein NDU88_009322 [Pleurodeles waltl]|uniref:Uncharacterized protein n=1 Tax=Pleurodeles waltl TaxID=8319 RepID=A0AAV7NYQ6_PLEWA|nr:hypothetical protein NDU88_009322 [Pleurodeles waltl]